MEGPKNDPDSTDSTRGSSTKPQHGPSTDDQGCSESIQPLTLCSGDPGSENVCEECTGPGTEVICPELVHDDIHERGRSISESSEDSDSSFDESEDCSSWSRVPCTILENIYRTMTYCERLRVSSVCKKWRQCLYTPRLWWHIDLSVTTKREGKKAYFLVKCVRFAKYVRIHWPAEYIRGEVRKSRPLDLHNKETLKALLNAMRECNNLRKLILKLENPCAFSPDFCRPVQDSLAIVCEQNTHLRYLSFGCNSTIIPPNIVDLFPEATKNSLFELHVARFKPSFSTSSWDTVPVLCNNDLVSFSKFIHLRELSVDWCNVNQGLVQGLTNRTLGAKKLKKLNIFVGNHSCSFQSHPTLEHWDEFSFHNPGVKISLTFVKDFVGICNSLQLIQPNVFLIKVLECPYVDPDDFGRLVHWHRESLKGIVFVGVWNDLEVETGPALWPHVASCFNINHLAMIGHFILDEILLFVVSHFSLQTFVMSRPHIMMLAEATHYLLPSSAGKYNQFKQEISAILQQPWDAMTRVTLEGFYFAEGKDDMTYITNTNSP